MKEHASPQTAVFAGGCFWCSESDFEKHKGIISVIPGYTGGRIPNPSYEDVSAGWTGHVEAVEVRFDPEQISYAQLLELFWRHIDPTDADGQFIDRGSQYRPIIFYQNEEQKQAAHASRDALKRSKRFDRPIATEILPAAPFYPAESYHQGYHKKNPLRYKFYRRNSGRDQFLERIWSSTFSSVTSEGSSSDGSQAQADTAVCAKPSESELKQRLTPLQYNVTQREGTEPPFDNAYWDNKQEGIYVDIVSGEPLFSSLDKYDSGTGWPSFSRPMIPENIVKKKDSKLFMVRTEVRSKCGDTHLGHVFEDGPAPEGLRYCINSASLRFVPREELEKEGYARFEALFKA